MHADHMVTADRRRTSRKMVFHKLPILVTNEIVLITLCLVSSLEEFKYFILPIFI
ncbi:MAG: hypothetical protein ACTS8A_00015 [Arsenophonus sp. ET-LJ4-MAG3]